MSEKAWSIETIEIINKLTPDIKGKGLDIDCFLLRQRFESVDDIIATDASKTREINALVHENRELKREIEELKTAASDLSQFERDL